MADWFDAYAKIMELNVWMSSTVVGTPSYSAAERLWTVTVDRNGEARTLHPRHIVLATGHSGEPNIPEFPGVKDFKGDRLCHSSQFSGAKADSAGLKAVIVGCCNSGHDIAQDYYERGADVTMVQRSSTYVMSSENGLEVLMGSLYVENGVSTIICCLTYMGEKARRANLGIARFGIAPGRRCRLIVSRYNHPGVETTTSGLPEGNCET